MFLMKYYIIKLFCKVILQPYKDYKESKPAHYIANNIFLTWLLKWKFCLKLNYNTHT